MVAFFSSVRVGHGSADDPADRVTRDLKDQTLPKDHAGLTQKVCFTLMGFM